MRPLPRGGWVGVPVVLFTVIGCTSSPSTDAGLSFICQVTGQSYDAGAPDPGNDCRSCQPLVNSHAFSPLADGTPCQHGVCAAGSCATDRCFVDAQLVAAGAPAPGGVCLSCQPEASFTAYTVSPDAIACTAGGTFCLDGGCAPLCLIDGGLLPADAGAPSGCQLCATQAPDRWSSRADGTSCAAGGTFCIDGGCALACLSPDAGLVLRGAFPPGDPSQCCNPGVSSSGYTPIYPPPGNQAPGPPPLALSAGNFNGPNGGRGLLLWDGAQVFLFLPDGDGGFGAGQLLGNSFAAPVAADLNGDGIDDVALIAAGGIALFLGQSGGQDGGLPVAGPLLPAPDGGILLAAARTTGSPYPDLALVARQSGVAGLWIFPNSAGTLTSGGLQTTLAPDTGLMASADFNGDGHYDLAFCSAGAVTVLVGSGVGTGFVDGGVWDIPAAIFNGIAAGELDGDGFDDLVVSYTDAQGMTPVVEYLGSSQGLVQSPSSPVPSVPASWLLSNVTIARFSSVALPGLAFVLRAPAPAGQLLLQLAAGNTLDAGSVTRTVLGGGPTLAVAASDFNADGQTDLAVGLGVGGFVVLWGQCP